MIEENKNKNMFLSLKSNYIKEYFDDVLYEFKSLFKTEYCKDLYNKISLSFEKNEASWFYAYASYDKKYCSNKIKNKLEICDYAKVVFNLEQQKNYTLSIIHELSHLIVDHYDFVKKLKHSGYHCLEFAIINYCLVFKYDTRHQRFNSCFINSYDIHEDVCYPILELNFSQFDSMIKTIEFNSIEELVEIAEIRAQNFREHSLL